MRYLERAWVRNLVENPVQIWYEDENHVVRDVTPDMVEHVLLHMVKQYAIDSPTFNCLRLADNKSVMAELTLSWKCQMRQRVSLVLLRKGTPGADLQPVDDSNPPFVLGASIMSVTSRSDNLPPMTELVDDLLLKKHLSAKIILTGTYDVFSENGVDCVLETDGLSVHRQFRGNGFAKILLQARLEMMRGLRLPVTKTMFVHPAAQAAAQKAGFEIVRRLPFEKIVDEDGNVIYDTLKYDVQLCIYRLRDDDK